MLEELDQPALLLAHSLGGVVALAVAQRHPELVRAALVIDPGLNVAEELALGDRLDNAVLEETLSLIHGAMPMTTIRRGVRTRHRPVVGEQPAPARRARARRGGRPDRCLDRVSFDIDRPVEVPVLVLLADPSRPDAIVGDDRQAQLEAAGSPDLEVVVMAGVGHNLQDEKAHRQTFLTHLDRWLATHG